MMRPTLIVAFFCFFFLGSFGQSISGQLVDENGESIFAANVYCKDNPQVGGVTDWEGNFQFSVAADCDTIICSYLGYESLSIPRSAFDGGPETITLNTATNLLSAIEVRAPNNITAEFAVTELSRLDIYLNPSAAADPLKAIATLPYSTNDDETANPALRGSDQTRTRVYLNGAPIERPVKNAQLNGVGYFSLFNTALIEKLLVYPSSPPLNFGNASAGIVEIETQTKSSENSLQLTAGLANTGLQLTKGFVDKGVMQIYGNWNLSEPFLALNQSALPHLNAFDAKDIGLNFAAQITKDWSLRFYSYLLDEGADVKLNLFTTLDTARSEATRNFNILNLKRNLPKGWVNAVFAYDWRNSNFNFGNIQTLDQERQFYSAVNWKHFFTDRLVLQTGFSFQYNQFHADTQRPEFWFAMGSDAPAINSDLEIGHENPEAYIYLSIPLFEKWQLGLGLRQGFYADMEENYTSYQSNLKIDLDAKQQLLFAAGHYHSFANPTYFYSEFDLLESDQLTLEYQYDHPKFRLQAASFFKLEKQASQPDRQIMGLELFWEQLWGKYWQSSIANTFLNVQYQGADRVYRAQNDYPYFLKLNLNYNNNRIVNVGLAALIRPGSRYTEIIDAQWNISASAFEPIYASDPFSERFTAYQSINLQISKNWSWKNQGLIAFINLNNVLNRANQSSFDYVVDYSERISRSFAGRTFYAGFVWSVSKND